ncbi:MAG: sensor histidine kinase [Burkholderiaceae bacterium]
MSAIPLATAPSASNVDCPVGGAPTGRRVRAASLLHLPVAPEPRGAAFPDAMPLDKSALAAFAARLAREREAILEAWRARVRDDPRLGAGDTLPIPLLNDHLTALLEDFERRLAADFGSDAASTDDAQRGDGAAHGLHRWQQGFDLSELTRELGRLNECVVEEIDRSAASFTQEGPRLAARVHALWARSHGAALTSSVEQFFQLQQAESAGQVKDLEAAVESLRSLEAQRSELWQEAAHDLRGNLSVVSIAAAGLTSAATADRRDKLLASLDRNVRSLNSLLADVTSLARLQGGHEVRGNAPMDAGRLMAELARAHEALGHERGLFLDARGPEAMPVEGDAVKVRRVVQNLLLNALRYTHSGGVTLSWGDEPANPAEQWFAQVKDTGPGLAQAPRGPLAGAIAAASAQSEEVARTEAVGEVAHIPPQDVPGAQRLARLAAAQAPGEGIGLSIVKRLCAMLDATISVASRPDEGATFRVVFPKRYASAPIKAA